MLDRTYNVMGVTGSRRGSSQKRKVKVIPWNYSQKNIQLPSVRKFYPLDTTDEYFETPYEEYSITICGQTIILTNGELAAALLSLLERKREIIFLYFFGDYTQREIGEMYGRCQSTTGYLMTSPIQCCGVCVPFLLYLLSDYTVSFPYVLQW